MELHTEYDAPARVLLVHHVMFAPPLLRVSLYTAAPADRYMVRNSERLFSTDDYYVAPPEYHRRGM